MKKNLTISIAAYNVENYLDNTLKSLLVDNMDKLEVIIINDGSKDNTSQVAQKYCKKYPQTFKLIDKENGGYGSTINAGIKAATGRYFKQLDGDDWYDTAGLQKLIDDIDNIKTDVIYTPFVTHYDETGKEEANKNNIVNHKNKPCEIDKIIGDIDVLFMHNLAYRTKMLKENKVTIDENCFYTDTEYVVLPFIYAETIYALDYPIYMYRMGREGQSISVEGRRKHWKDHQRVSYTLMEIYKQNKAKLGKNKDIYFEEYLASIFASGIGNYLLTLDATMENFEIIKKYNRDIETISREIYSLMPKYSRAVTIVRKNNYIIYKMFSAYKKFRWRLK